MIMPSRRLRLAVGVTLAAAAGLAAAQQYPTRPIRMVVPFAPGGPTDVVGRMIAAGLTTALGQQVVVDNRPGAAGNIGIGTVARAPGDGYTLLMTSSAFVVNPALFLKPPYDPFKDFAPVSNTCVSPNLLYVHLSIPAKTVKELASHVASQPGKFSMATPGMGTTPHLAAEMLKLALKLDVPLVPYNGAAPVLQATMGNQTSIALSAISPVIPHIKAGALRGLAVTSQKRSASLPDLPTLAESGYPDQISETFQAVLVPAGTPRPIVERLHGEIVKMFARPEFKERIGTLGLDITTSSPTEFAQQIREEIVRWKKVVKDSNIKPE